MRSRHAGGRQAVQFLHQRRGIDGDPGAQEVGHAGAEHTRGQLVQGEPPEVVDDGVTGVAAALKAGHHAGAGGQGVGDLALALVAPGGADHGGDGHGSSSGEGEACPRGMCGS